MAELCSGDGGGCGAVGGVWMVVGSGLGWRTGGRLGVDASAVGEETGSPKQGGCYSDYFVPPGMQLVAEQVSQVKTVGWEW